MKVLHYKSNFLNLSETFIQRVIRNHQDFTPVGMCIREKNFTEDLEVHSKPQTGFPYLINTVCFHLNWTLPFYKKTIHKVNPNVIHAHFGFDGYRMIKPAQLSDTPLVVSFYGSDVSRLPGEFDWKRRYRNLAESGDAFIAATNHMKRRLIELGFPEPKIHVIPFGLELDKFNFDEGNSKPFGLMMVGRMVEKKGFKYAIEAIHDLKERGKSCRLDLYGDGPLRKKLGEKVCRLGLKDLVHFHGHVPIEKVISEHENHDILLAPSLTADDGDEEGLPNTILEAMASGTLVITTNHAAIGEVIKNKQNGLIITEGDYEALARAIEYARSLDSDTRAMRMNARQTIEMRFKIQEIISRIESLYKKTIGKNA